MAQYTTATLLNDIRVGGMLPNSSASSPNALFTDAELLRMADREMQIGIVPLVMSVREEYFVTHLDVPVSQTVDQTILIPYRAIGGKVRDLQLMANDSAYQPIPQIDLSDRSLTNQGFYVEGNVIHLFNPVASWQALTVRMSYFRRPNKLVLPAACGVVTSASGSTIVMAAAVTGFIGAGYQGATPLDYVRQQPGYETLAMDQLPSISSATLTTATPLTSDPVALAAGDYICLAEESPVPQIPPEMHPVLAQRVICKVMEAVGDSNGLQMATAKLAEAEHAALTLLTPRVDGEVKKFVNRSSPMRRQRRWMLY